jgi:NAD(P)-dependent dehydrogenase (short-subunit alcohol dehydrogenase family)
MDLDLTGKVALVTGGGSGIGAACAAELAGLGAHVVVADVRLDAARAVAEHLGDPAVAVAADVTDPVAAQAMVTAALDRFGRLDIAVNSAGIGAPELVPLGRASWPAWQRVTAVNLDGIFLSMRARSRRWARAARWSTSPR